MEFNHCVYIVRCGDGTLYTGYTNHLKRRLSAHKNGKGAKYTRGRQPITLVYKQYFLTKREAMQEEYRIKQLTRQQKQQLIEKEQLLCTNNKVFNKPQLKDSCT